MVPEIGQFALILAFCLAILQATMPIIGAHRGNKAWMALARPAAQGQCLFVAIAFFALVSCFINNDFSVLYAASHSNTQLPLIYRIAGVWGGHEGSLLLWVFFLCLWTLAVTLFSRHLDEAMIARVVGVMGIISLGFLAFMLFTSNPFERLLPAALDGKDLNPLLQDLGLVIHPPMLYMGYVGFSVAFSFAIAALLSGKLDAAWARWSRPWTTAAWVFLTFGIALGSWWAYYELGWGGWWFWDPVENASFMPWLVGTALIHSLAMTEKRGSFRSWTVLLAIATFSLSLLGAFLVRSGVLTSVHSFATDPERGVFILAFLTLVVGGSLVLFAWRAPKIGLGGDFAVVSRESMLLSNNVLLVVAAGTVLLGTLYPLFLDALDLGKLSVGPPYFESVFVPIMAAVVFMMGLGPISRWKKQALPELAVRLRWAALISVVTSIVVPLLMGHWSISVSFGILLAAWVITTGLNNLSVRIKSMTTGGTLLGKFGSLSRSYYGMLVAHSGIAIFIIGVTLVKGYEVEKDVRMDVGDTVSMSGYTFRFDGVIEVPGPNYKASRGLITVIKDGKEIVVMHPEKRIYNVQQQPMTEAAIDATFTRHLYLALGEPVSNGAWSVRVYYKPFIGWIWGGCVLMGLGGILAISDRRYRLAKQQKRVTVLEGGTPANTGTGGALAMEAKD